MRPAIAILARLPLLLGAILIAIGGGVRVAAAQTTITLNISARFEAADAVVRLANIARLEGPESARLGEVVVLDRADAAASVGLSDVRARLQAAGANPGKITLRGASCRIDLPSAVSSPARPRVERKSPGGPDYQVVDTSGPPTIRTAVARRLAAMYGVPADAMQIAFDEKDSATISTPYTDRQIVQVQPAASTSSSRVPIRISVFVADKVIADYRLTVDVLLRRDVLVATRDLDRRDIIAEADLRLEPRWLAPGTSPVSRETVLGSQVRSRVKEGEPFTGADLEAPVVIKRGDVVYVQCLTGSIIVQARARAMGPGREGETIAFQMEGADEPFMARVAGRGRAVMLSQPSLPAADERPQLRTQREVLPR